jgi:catechol 2,3-dioxygenase-like lactoylglutathione lyase family enzyme
MITGVHHVCMKCRSEELEKVQKFYGELLGLPLVRSWGEPKVEGLMYGAGTSLIEIFPNAEEDLPFRTGDRRCGQHRGGCAQGRLCCDDGAGRY